MLENHLLDEFKDECSGLISLVYSSGLLRLEVGVFRGVYPDRSSTFSRPHIRGGVITHPTSFKASRQERSRSSTVLSVSRFRPSKREAAANSEREESEFDSFCRGPDQMASETWERSNSKPNS